MVTYLCNQWYNNKIMYRPKYRVWKDFNARCIQSTVRNAVILCSWPYLKISCSHLFENYACIQFLSFLSKSPDAKLIGSLDRERSRIVTVHAPSSGPFTNLFITASFVHCFHCLWVVEENSFLPLLILDQPALDGRLIMVFVHTWHVNLRRIAINRCSLFAWRHNEYIC